MDPRVREHAELLVEWSARIEPGDNVVVSVAEGTHDLAVAVADVLGEIGANVATTYASDEVERAYQRAHDGDFETPTHERALYEHADSALFLKGGRNTFATADVDGETQKAAKRANSPIREARLATDWVSTLHPTRSLAQQAEMAYEAYQDFLYDAILRDWDSLAAEMGQLKDRLDQGSEVRLVRGDAELTMSIEGRTAVNSAASVAYGSHNLPSGEVFTAPYNVEGEVRFDVPMTISGSRVRDLWLRFEDGRVVDYDAAVGAATIGDVLDTDPGARSLGELGIGMNRGIDRVTGNGILDEKMGDTIHLALGRAYDACVPAGESGNESAVHVDLITDVSADARLEIDDEVVQRNGRFRWEDGFRSA
jgi:aminopeptidase